MLDTGAQVSIVGKNWVGNVLQTVPVRPIESLLTDNQLHITAANGSIIPFEG